MSSRLWSTVFQAVLDHSPVIRHNNSNQIELRCPTCGTLPETHSVGQQLEARSAAASHLADRIMGGHK